MLELKELKFSSNDDHGHRLKYCFCQTTHGLIYRTDADTVLDIESSLCNAISAEEKKNRLKTLSQA